eukprot:scaffold630_cov399-Prasinococcus_capsulatus_cf.AAC.24
MGIEELQAEGGPPSDVEDEREEAPKEMHDGRGFFSEAAEVKVKKKSKKKRSKAIEDSEDEEEEEEEEAEAGQDYERDGFVVDEEEVEDDKADEEDEIKSEDEEELQELDEEDYDLLEENQVTGIKRPRKPDQMQKKKKLRRAGAGDTKDTTGTTNTGDEVAPKGTDVAALREKLFGVDGLEDEDADLGEEQAKAKQQQMEEEDFVSEGEDEMADFIVDEQDVDEHGELKAQRRKRRLPKSSIVSSTLLHEAQEIFGDVNELLELHAQAELEEEDDEEYAEEELDDEGQPVLRKPARPKKLALDPGELSKGFFTDFDEQVRQKDIPERIQLRHASASAERQRDTSDAELALEAEWIFEQLLDPDNRRSAEYTYWCPAKRVKPHNMDKYFPPLEDDVVDEVDHADDVADATPEALLAREIKMKRLMNKEHVMKTLLIDAIIYQDDETEETSARYWKRHDLRKSVLSRQIHEFLRLSVVEMHEVPYIGMHKKESIFALLVTEDSLEELEFPADEDDDDRRQLDQWALLWRIVDMDRKWITMRHRAAKLKESLPKTENQGLQVLLGTLMTDLDTVHDPIKASDIESQLLLYMPEAKKEPGRESFKRAQRKTLHAACQRAGIGELLPKIGLSAKEFSENLARFGEVDPDSIDIVSLQQQHQVQDDLTTGLMPEDLAESFTNKEFDAAEKVLKAARQMLAIEIAHEPNVRQFIRDLYYDLGVVTTTPSVEGNRVIDGFHRYARVKWLWKRPLTHLRASQDWLLIQSAESELLLRSRILLCDRQGNPDMLDKVRNVMRKCFTSDGVSALAKAWNDFRSQVIDEALDKHLVPLIAKEIRQDLKRSALDRYGQVFMDYAWKRLITAPIKVGFRTEDNMVQTSANVKIMAFHYDKDSNTTAVVLDESGNLLDFMYFADLHGRIMRNGATRRQEKEMDDLLDFLAQEITQPDVIVVGGNSMECGDLRENVRQVVFKLLEDRPRDVAAHRENIDTVLADEHLSKLVADSDLMMQEFPDHPASVRRAVALGRCLRDPLATGCALLCHRESALSLKLHALQDWLVAERRLELMERIACTIVNQVGVDVNSLLAATWRRPLVQFVNGLGPRKTVRFLAGLQRCGIQYNRIASRMHLVQELVDINQELGSKVMMEAIATLLVTNDDNLAPVNIVGRSSDLDDQALEDEKLDSTRIHPRNYKLVADLAAEAAKRRKEDLEDPVDAVFRDPSLIDGLNLWELSRRMEKASGARKYETLNDICSELRWPANELRPQYRPPDKDEQFYMLCQETPESLQQGMVVQVEARMVTENGVDVIFDNGLRGFIRPEDLSSSFDAEGGRGFFDCRTRVRKGDVISARILHLNKDSFDRYRAYLTSKTSELKDAEKHEAYLELDREENYKVKHSEPYDKKEKEAAQPAPGPEVEFIARKITHPYFKNISYKAAVAELSQKKDGGFIIHPSSIGCHMLNVTVHYKGVTKVLRIIEGGKSGTKGTADNLKLGSPLTVKQSSDSSSDPYDDLDELIFHFLEPYVQNFRGAIKFRKYLKGTKAEVDGMLMEELKRKPKQVPYCIAFAEDRMRFMLA